MRKLLVTLDDDLDERLKHVVNQNEVVRVALRLYLAEDVGSSLDGLRAGYAILAKALKEIDSKIDYLAKDRWYTLGVLLLSPEEKTKFDSLSPEQQKILGIGRDYERFRKNNLKIRTKDSRVIPLDLKPIQQKVVDAVLDCLIQGKPIRFIILKARQEGVSTVIESLIYWWTANHKNVTSKIVAHDTPTAEKLYAMFVRYLENSNQLFQPSTKRLRSNALTFDNEDGTGLKSQIDTASADTLATGRGDTIHWLHASEVSVWRVSGWVDAGRPFGSQYRYFPRKYR